MLKHVMCGGKTCRRAGTRVGAGGNKRRGRGLGQAYARTNSIKITNHWRNLMRQAKTAELRAELDNIRQAFERALDRKDALIQACDRPYATPSGPDLGLVPPNPADALPAGQAKTPAGEGGGQQG